MPRPPELHPGPHQRPSYHPIVGTEGGAHRPEVEPVSVHLAGPLDLLRGQHPSGAPPCHSLSIEHGHDRGAVHPELLGEAQHGGSVTVGGHQLTDLLSAQFLQPLVGRPDYLLDWLTLSLMDRAQQFRQYLWQVALRKTFFQGCHCDWSAVRHGARLRLDRRARAAGSHRR
jgi:hypothetical protein